MNQIIIKEIAADYEKVRPFLFASKQNELIQGGDIFAALEDGNICGAIGSVDKSGEWEILSLYVEKRYRGKGVGSRLLNEIYKKAQEKGARYLSASYSCTREQNVGIEGFFLKNDFLPSIQGEVLYSICMDKIEESVFGSQKSMIEKIENKISGIFELPVSIREKSKIPQFMLPEKAPGNLLKDLCLAYVSKGSIRSCIVMCDTGKGNLHLHSTFLENSNCGVYLIGLLQKAFAIVKERYSGFKYLTITGASEKEKNLIEYLFQGTGMEIKTAYYTKCPIIFEKEPWMNESRGVLPRFHTLADALAENGIASKLRIPDIDEPYMELTISGVQTPMQVYYEVLGEDSYSGFELKTLFEITAEVKESKRLKNINWEEFQGEVIDVYENDEGDIWLLGKYKEDSAYEVEESVEQFILPFIQKVVNLIKKV